MTTRPDTDAPTRTGFSQRPRVTTPHRSESQLEKMLNDGVRHAGGMSYKLAPITAGTPDRIVFWPGGRIDMIELKTTKGKTRPIQEIEHYRLAKLGTDVRIIRGQDELREYLSWASRGFRQHKVTV